ncbi:hypothetical protein GCM10022222_27440 [Amycolatopsis ultiminotia]|uniref:HTH tetR-type domain-containing protein n=1 Tax=Amycolatopsis ultiminotia TaxID=543629 RepID=A0ABP6W0L0_9PSEU
MVGNADKRQHILDVAIRLAAEEGLRGLSVRSVAAAAGIGATTLRTYFPSQALLHRAVAEQQVSLALSEEWIQDISLAPVERLSKSLRQFLPTAQNRHSALSAWFELLTLALGPEAGDEVLELVRSAHRESIAIVTRWLTQLAADGAQLRETPELLAERFQALLAGLHLNLLLDKDEQLLGRAEDTVRWFAEQAIAAEVDTAAKGS